jgi:hypothetical protein
MSLDIFEHNIRITKTIILQFPWSSALGGPGGGLFGNSDEVVISFESSVYNLITEVEGGSFRGVGGEKSFETQ